MIAAATVVPAPAAAPPLATATPPAPPRFRQLVRRVVLEPALVGAALVPPALPLCLLLAVVNNAFAGELAADGVDVRRPGVVDQGDAETAIFILGSVLLNAHSIAVARSVLAGRGRRPDRAHRIREAAYFALVVGSHSAACIARAQRTLWYQGYIAVTAAAWLVVLARSADRLVEGRGRVARHLAQFGVAASAVISLHLTAIYPAVFSRALGDARRILYVALLPFVFDVLGYPVRALASSSTAAASGSSLWTYTPAVSLLAFQHLTIRSVVLSMTTAWGQAGAAAAVGVAEMLSRHSMRWRDRVYGGRGGGSSSRGVAGFIYVDQALEVWATVLAGALFAIFRVGSERVAPSGGGIAAASALQLLLELACDVGLLLAASALRRRSPALRRSLRILAARSSVVAGWWRDVRFWGVAAFCCATISFWVMTSVTSASRRQALCPWSRGGGTGWWARVPCSMAEEWLGD